MENEVKSKVFEFKENILGIEKIGKLIKKFAVPAIISMLVNSLYNIVDQVFIGWGVGYLGNGATNIVFPLTMIALAFSLMFGDGASAFLSLKLGEKNKIDAGKGIGAGIVLSVVISLLYTLLVFIFLNPILNFFGCTDELREFAIIAFRTYLMFCIVNGIQIPAGIFFQAIGKSIKSAIVSLSRQIVILISSMILLGYFFEIRGLLYSGPLVEGLAFLIALVF